MTQSRFVWWSRRFGYAFGSAYRGIPLGSVGALYLFYLTVIVGLEPALAGAVLALPKVWDAFVDPLLGTWVDRHATRVGRRWPFLLVAGATSLLAYVGMFSLPNLSSHSAIAAAALALLIINSMAETTFGVCHLSISAEISKDSVELSGLFSLALTLFSIMNIVGSALPPLYIAASGGGRIGYSHMAINGGAIAFLILLACIALISRVPVSKPSREASSLSFLASFRATAANESFIYVLIYFVIASAGTAILSAFTPYANLYIFHGGPSGLAVLGGIIAGSLIVGFPLAAPLVRQIGIRRSLRSCNVALLLAYATLFAASFGPTWLSWTLIAIVGISSGVSSVVLLAVLVDVARAPVRGGLVVPLGFYYGVIVSGTKLGLSAGGFVSGLWLAVIGFVPGSTHQSSVTLMGIRASFTVLLVILFGIAGLLINRMRIDSEQCPSVASGPRRAPPQYTPL